MTRDPARIEPMLKLLRDIWLRNPDLRLGQVITTAAVLGGWKDDDVFHCEDDIVQRGLEYV